MRYWIFMFRPDTYEKVKEHQTIGVCDSVRKRFAQVQKGDRFIRDRLSVGRAPNVLQGSVCAS